MLGIIFPTLLATASVYASPFHKRGMDQVISQCKHNFAYTFDDGPYTWNSDLVDKFDSVGGKTTFFVNGNNWRCIYSEESVKSLRYAFEKGHLIAGHSWSHANLTSLTDAQIGEEIERLDDAFVKILGVKPKLFRPPYGEINERVASLLQSKYHKTIIMWDLDSGDTFEGANEQKSIDFYKKLAAEGPGSKHLTLSHEVHNYSVNAAKDATVDDLHKAGITLLTVAQCLDIEDPYERVGGYGERDETWTCDAPSTDTSSPSNQLIGTTVTCKETYQSKEGDTCASIDTTYKLVSGTVQAANSFPDCTNIGANTAVCIPDGPYFTADGEPGCKKQTYMSVKGDNCHAIETRFALRVGSIVEENPWVGCDDIWPNTFLTICVPVIDVPKDCPKKTMVGTKTTCADVGAENGLSDAWIKALNPWLYCDNIWPQTGLCVGHSK